MIFPSSPTYLSSRGPLCAICNRALPNAGVRVILQRPIKSTNLINHKSQNSQSCIYAVLERSPSPGSLGGGRGLSARGLGDPAEPAEGHPAAAQVGARGRGKQVRVGCIIADFYWIVHVIYTCLNCFQSTFEDLFNKFCFDKSKSGLLPDVWGN